MELKAGQLYLFTEGEYSDYGHVGAFVALETVASDRVAEVVKTIKERERAAEEKQGWYDGDSKEEFIAALIKQGWLLSLAVTEQHIGSYRNLEVS